MSNLEMSIGKISQLVRDQERIIDQLQEKINKIENENNNLKNENNILKGENESLQQTVDIQSQIQKQLIEHIKELQQNEQYD